MDQRPSPTEAYGSPHQLDYTIHSCSSCSASYHPFNIIEDAPTQPNSRWSGSGPPNPSVRPTNAAAYSSDQLPASHSQPFTEPSSLSYPGQLPKRKEYIIIDLGKPCVVRSVTFGKFHRPHPCNVKLFRIWGSLAPGEGRGDFRALLDCRNQNGLVANETLESTTQYRHYTQGSSSSKLQDNQLDASKQDTGSGLPKSNLPNTHKVRVRGERHTSGPRMELLAQGELKNDPLPETVQLRWKNTHVPWFKTTDELSLNNSAHDSQTPPSDTASNLGIVVPIRYLKIEPLSAAGSNYNCSIWHISVRGHDEDHIVEPCLEIYEKWKASAALRLCLKHLRQAGHLEAFQCLLKSSANFYHSPTLVSPSSDGFPHHLPKVIQQQYAKGDIQSSGRVSTRFHFEHALASALHASLLPHSKTHAQLIRQSSPPGNSQVSFNSMGSILNAEQIVRQAASEGLFDDWARVQPPTLICRQIRAHSELGSEIPCPRGGHQMCIDSKRRKIWLFGGFDGRSDLGDLWVFHLPDFAAPFQRDDTIPWNSIRDETMVTEPKTIRQPQQTINSRSTSTARQDNWQLISSDVRKDHGPSHRSCHKMVLDELTGDLYILGRYSDRGRVHSASAIPHPEKATLTTVTTEQRPDHASTQIQVSSTIDAPENGVGGQSDLLMEVSDLESDNPFLNDLLRRTAPHLYTSTSIAPKSTSENVTEGPPLEAKDHVMSDGESSDFILPGQQSVTGHFNNDFFRFRPYSNASCQELWLIDGRIGQWECLSRDTQADGGPKLIFDHQMVLDSETRKIYVFGGKIIHPCAESNHQEGDSLLPQNSSRTSQNQYSGLFEYDMTTKSWVELMTDPASSSSNSIESGPTSWTPSRMGHSLILDKKRQCLWIFSGERDGLYYSDLWKYTIPTGKSELIVTDYTHGPRERYTIDEDSSASETGPEAGFSQRTTFDAEADEWHMFCGLCKDRATVDSASKPIAKEIMSSEFWRWRINEGKWARVAMMIDHNGADAPPPRFAHQMVFDELTKNHYVFGGNPADNDNEPTRLGDFWRLKLIQSNRDEALRRCLFALRRQHFIELCEEGTDTVASLVYLQNDLSSVTNHLDENEARLFRACTSHLLAGPGPRLPLLEEDIDDNDRTRNEEDLVMDELDQAQARTWTAEGSPTTETQDQKLLNHRLRPQRTRLFQDLLKFFPESMTEPEQSLLDLIDVWGDRDTFW